MSKKLTPWYPGHIKPVRPGVYQQRSGYEKRLGFQWWNGKKWSSWFSSAESALLHGRNGPPADLRFQNDPWRGLAQEPKA